MLCSMVQKTTRTRQISSTFMFSRSWTIQVKWYEDCVKRWSKEITVVALSITGLSKIRELSDKFLSLKATVGGGDRFRYLMKT